MALFNYNLPHGSHVPGDPVLAQDPLTSLPKYTIFDRPGLPPQTFFITQPTPFLWNHIVPHRDLVIREQERFSTDSVLHHDIHTTTRDLSTLIRDRSLGGDGAYVRVTEHGDGVYTTTRTVLERIQASQPNQPLTPFRWEQPAARLYRLSDEHVLRVHRHHQRIQLLIHQKPFPSAPTSLRRSIIPYAPMYAYDELAIREIGLEWLPELPFCPSQRAFQIFNGMHEEMPVRVLGVSYTNVTLTATGTDGLAIPGAGGPGSESHPHLALEPRPTQVDIVRFGKVRMIHRGDAVREGDILVLQRPSKARYEAIRTKQLTEGDAFYGHFAPARRTDALYAETQARLGSIWSNLKSSAWYNSIQNRDGTQALPQFLYELFKDTPIFNDIIQPMNEAETYYKDAQESIYRSESVQRFHSIQLLGWIRSVLVWMGNHVLGFGGGGRPPAASASASASAPAPASAAAASSSSHASPHRSRASMSMSIASASASAIRAQAAEFKHALDAMELRLEFKTLVLLWLRRIDASYAMEEMEKRLVLLHRALELCLLELCRAGVLRSEEFMDRSSQALTGLLEAWSRLIDRVTFQQRRQILGFALEDIASFDSGSILVHTL